MLRKFRLCAVALLLSLFASGGAHGTTMLKLEHRAPTESERTSFLDWYKRHFPHNHRVAPVFAVSRLLGEAGPWERTASVDFPPVRGLGQLCRAHRAEFAIARGYTDWGAAGDGLHVVWLDSSASCRRPAQPVRLAARLPDAELVAVLGQQARLLDRARLLMSGHSGCASMRAAKFSLFEIDVRDNRSDPEQMLYLEFRNDDDMVGVWLRRNADGYGPWNVDCGEIPPWARP